jgi:hypothetical protein
LAGGNQKTLYHLHVLDVGTVEEINDIATQNLLSDALYVFVLKSELAFVHKSLTLNSLKCLQKERLSVTGDKRGTKVH